MLTNLELSILDARDRGDTAELKRLQAEYRERGLIRGGGTCEVVEGGISRSVVSRSVAQDEREVPVLRERAEPTVAVVLSNTARQRIENDLFALTRSDGKECGGYLFGPKFYGLNKPIEIRSATRTWDARRAEDSLWLDSAAWLATEQAIAKEGLDEELCGSWHCHPLTHVRKPSSADLAAWLGMRDFFEGRRWSSKAHIGLIYSARYDPRRGESSWADPEVSAWVVKRDRWGSPVCEPASLRERR